MQPNSDKTIFLYPAGGVVFEAMRDLPSLGIFSSEAVEWLNALSVELMRNPLTRTMPDVATFAFFCRKGHIAKLREQYTSNQLRLGRGLLFHVAPSNVPVNFAYSLVCGVLSGNANVVRVPSKEFEQVRLILSAVEAIGQAIPENEIVKRVVLVRYERGSSATDLLSSLCDVRVIWGGDATIAQIRQSAIPPRSFDVTFADRYSICAIRADQYLATADAAKVAEGFYNDTYLFDQNACSAPHLVVWVGRLSDIAKAKEQFWAALYAYAKQRYTLADVLAVDKLTSFYAQSISMDIHKETTPDNLLWRVEADSLPRDIDTYRCKAGYFTEYDAPSLDVIGTIVNRKYQTLAYYGFSTDELKHFFEQVRPIGLDRMVPIGKTTDFSLVWDSYDLITTLSRIVNIL